MSSQIEVAVDGRMNGGEFLKASHPPETTVPRESDRLVAHLDPALVEKILDMA